MSTRDHSKFAEVMAGLLTVAVVIVVFFAVLMVCALANDPRLETSPAEDFLNPATIAIFTLLFLMTLNPLQSCLYRLHPAWSIVFITIFAVCFAYDLMTVLHFREPLIIDLPLALYSLLGLAASIIALIVRRGEWRKRRFRDAPCYWWDIFMVYTIFLLGTIPFAIFEYVYLTIAIAGFAARHIYIVRALVRDEKAFRIRCAKQETAAIAEAQSA